MAGNANPYFISRMDATAFLSSWKKIKKNHCKWRKSKGYNEPKAMKNFLIYQGGVPENIILEDPKVLIPCESILRCKMNTKQKRNHCFTRIS